MPGWEALRQLPPVGSVGTGGGVGAVGAVTGGLPVPTGRLGSPPWPGLAWAVATATAIASRARVARVGTRRRSEGAACFMLAPSAVYGGDREAGAGRLDICPGRCGPGPRAVIRQPASGSFIDSVSGASM